MDRADSGTIHVDGVRTDRLPADRIARLGVGCSFQTSRVFPALNVWDSVLVGVQARLIETASGRLVDQVYEVPHGWKAQGITILLVEQNARMALELADRAYVLQHGKVVVTGKARQLANSPPTHRSARPISAPPEPTACLTSRRMPSPRRFHSS